jgi:hypothetical protein
MAISRYRNLNLIDGKYYETSDFPSKKQLDSIPVIRVRIGGFERFDQLAFKHLGSGEYWWVIALMNDISWAFAATPGQVIKIPVNVEDVLRLF